MTISPDRTRPFDADYRFRTDLLQRLFPSIQYELTQIAAALSIESATASRWLGLATPDLDEVGNAGRRATAQIARAATLMRDVSALGGVSSPGIEPISVCDLISQSVALARESLYRARASVNIRLPHDLAEAHADRVLAQQVLLEMLLHAVAGQAFNSEPCVIDVGAHRQDDLIHISIVRTPVAGGAARQLPPELRAVALQAGGKLCQAPPAGIDSVLSFPRARDAGGTTVGARIPETPPAHPPA